MADLWSGTYKSPKFWDETAAALIALAELPSGSAVLDVGGRSSRHSTGSVTPGGLPGLT